MRVLVVCNFFPWPPMDGRVLPAYHFLRCLAPRVEYHVVCIRPDRDATLHEGRRVYEALGVALDAVPTTRLDSISQTMASLSAGQPWVNRQFYPALATRVRERLTEKWDVVEVVEVMAAQHLPRQLPCKALLVARDCLSLRHWRAMRTERSPAEAVRWAKIRWMERSLVRRFDRVLAIAEPDLRELQRAAPGVPIDLLPNGVDTNDFAPQPEREEADLVVFAGNMAYRPNVDAACWFARDVWPTIRRARPEARLVLVGRDPVAAVKALASDSIEVTGTVPRIQDVVARASVVVSPLRYGTGMKNKVLEAAAMGKAMVVSPVSLEDLSLVAERDLIVADGAGAFAQSVLELLGDSARRAELGASARQHVESNESWEAKAEILFATYEALLRSDETVAPGNSRS